MKTKISWWLILPWFILGCFGTTPITHENLVNYKPEPYGEWLYDDDSADEDSALLDDSVLFDDDDSALDDDDSASGDDDSSDR